MSPNILRGWVEGARIAPRLSLALATIVALTMSAPAWAVTDSGPKQPDKRKIRHAGQKRQNRSTSHEAARSGALPFVPPLTTRSPLGLTASVDTKGVTLKGDDNLPELVIGGRVNLDASAGSLRPRSIGPALSDNAELRRAWLEPTLKLPNGIIANLQYDFSETDQPVNNALIAYRGLEPFIFTVGNFKEPFSLDQLIANNNTLFAERSLLDTFAPARDFGASVGTHGDRWTAVAGVFGGNINTDLAENGIAGTARLTYAPILTDQEVLHFGVAGSYRKLDESDTALSFSSAPEDNLAASNLVDTGPLKNAADVGRFGLEALYQNGGGRIQAEYTLTTVGERGGGVARVFHAGYIQAAYVLNGNGPDYKLVPPHGSEYAVLGGVKVPDDARVSNGGAGVFEFGARLSAITLESGSVRGGTELNGTLGVNWYPDHNIRLMADYVRAHAAPVASSVLLDGEADSNLFIGRLQFYW